MFTDVVMCLVGILFMFGAFYAIGFSRRFRRDKEPYGVISKTGRFIIFVGGMAIFINGVEELMGRYDVPARGWRALAPFVAVLLFGLLLNSRFVRTYMGRGQEKYPMVGVDFPGGLPSAMVGVRIAFCVIVVAMVTFGVFPMPDSVAQKGIIACVFALFAIGVLYTILEHSYVKTGRAIVQSTGSIEEGQAHLPSQSRNMK